MFLVSVFGKITFVVRFRRQLQSLHKNQNCAVLLLFRISHNHHKTTKLKQTMAKSQSTKASKPKAKAKKKANQSLKNLQSREMIQDFQDAQTYLRSVTEDVFDIVAKDPSHLSPDLKRSLRKLKIASFGVDVTAEAVTEEVKKDTGSYAGYVHKRKMKASGGIGLKVSSASMPENVANIIEAAKGNKKDDSDPRSPDLRERTPPKKKKKKSNAASSISACSPSDYKVKVYSVEICRPAVKARIKVPTPADGSMYQPLEQAVILSRIDQRFRRKLAVLWRESGLVPVNDQQCARLCQKYIRGEYVS